MKQEHDFEGALEAFERLLKFFDEHCDMYCIETLEQEYSDDEQCFTDITTIRAALMPQWNEDMESAPHGVWLLITTEFGHVWQMCHHAKGYWLGQDNTIISRRPKAWMPLPTPPQSGEKEGE